MRYICLVAAFVLFAVSGTPARAESEAQSVVRAFYSHLVSSMKQGDKLGFNGRYEKLSPVVQSAFDLPLMAKAAVSTSWSDATDEQKKEIISAFAAFSISTYATRFSSYDGEEFVVVGERTTGKDIIVETQLKPKDGDPIALNYLMRKDDKGAYKIVDVYLNGMISELATRRSEFSSIARREGIPALLNSLQAKTKQMGAS